MPLAAYSAATTTIYVVVAIAVPTLLAVASLAFVAALVIPAYLHRAHIHHR